MPLVGKDALVTTGAQLPTDRVDVPELGEGMYVLVRGIGGTQRDAYEKAMWIHKGNKRVLADNARAKLVVQCLIDESGSLMYAAADIPAIGRIRVTCSSASSTSAARSRACRRRSQRKKKRIPRRQLRAVHLRARPQARTATRRAARAAVVGRTGWVDGALRGARRRSGSRAARGGVG